MLHAANLSPAVAASELLKANTSAGTQPCGIAVSYYFTTRLTYFTIKRARRVLAKELSFSLHLLVCLLCQIKANSFQLFRSAVVLAEVTRARGNVKASGARRCCI
jgi:hypothetical protein